MEKSWIHRLDGYLQSLRRLSGNQCDFWAELIEIETDLESDLTAYLRKKSIAVLDRKPVGIGELRALLDLHLLSKLKVDDADLHRLLAWDIIEFIRMSYRMRQSRPVRDPISRRESFVADVGSDFHGKRVIIAIPVERRCIAISLATRADPSSIVGAPPHS